MYVYDMIWCIYLTAVGFTPGGSNYPRTWYQNTVWHSQNTLREFAFLMRNFMTIGYWFAGLIGSCIGVLPQTEVTHVWDFRFACHFLRRVPCSKGTCCIRILSICMLVMGRAVSPKRRHISSLHGSYYRRLFYKKRLIILTLSFCCVARPRRNLRIRPSKCQSIFRRLCLSDLRYFHLVQI
jgi:hypothetical protein